MPSFKRTAQTLLMSGTLALASAAQAGENVMVVFDGSNSMWGQIDGKAKIEIARDVMDNLLGDWTADREVGLMAYGHRRRGDCTDIETLVQPGAAARDDILNRINAITPTGKTPLTAAIEQAATALSFTDQPATVVLISDGLESCERDPCALAEALEKSGVDFTAHVVGFGLGGDADTGSLSCIADKTGGEFISASNADELGAALSAVGDAVAEAPAPEPEPVPEPELPEVTLTGPATAITGSTFTVSWDPQLKNDYVAIVPAGAQDTEFGNYSATKDASQVELRAPADAGLYELRYIDRDTRAILGTASIEIVEPEITVSAPDSVPTGATFMASVTGKVSNADYVAIVPVGSDEGTFGNYEALRDKSEQKLTAPANAGLYEVRYILREGNKTMASTPIEVTEPEITVTAPASVTTGAAFDVSVTGKVNDGDYVAIVPVGADEGSFGNYETLRDKDERSLKAPADPGLYEVRYILREGSKTMASAPVEVTDATVTLTAPETVRVGEDFTVSWTNAVNGNDYVAIVPVGSDEGEFGNYGTVSDKTERKLRAPAETGLYEVRYILREGSKTMARVMTEVVAAEVTVSGPATAVTGESITVSWTGAVSTGDYVNIVPMGAEEGTFGSYRAVSDDTEAKLTVPSEPGMYELRYVLREGAKTLASQTIEVGAPEVSVSGPTTAAAGAVIRVSWTGAVGGTDYINIVPMGADEGTFGTYAQVRDKTELDLRMPGDPGLYELRYVLREGGKTLASQPMEATLSEVTLDAPEQIRLGDTLRITWSDAVNPMDYINLSPMGADDAAFDTYFQVRDKQQYDMKSPETPGLYELRYLLKDNSRVLARRTVEVLPADAALNTGATLSAPASAAAGSVIDVSWSVDSDSADQRITLAKADQAIFTWVEAVKIPQSTADAPSVQITLPDAPGIYELRFLDVSAQAVLARQVITVE